MNKSVIIKMMTKNDKETELSTTNKTNKEFGNRNGETRNPKQNGFVKKVKKVFGFFTVEPFLLCYMLPSFIISDHAAFNFYKEKACRADLNYSQEICDNLRGMIDDNITREASTKSEILVAEMSAWMVPLQYIPVILMLNVGAWSDRTGNRKALMLFPLLCNLLSSLLLILTTYYFLEWPLWATRMIEALPHSVALGSGLLSIALLGSFSYIADMTNVESRTNKIGIACVIVLKCIPLASSMSEFFIESVGYYGIFGISFVIYLLGFIYTYFGVHDVRKTVTEGTLCGNIIQVFHPKNIWSTISLVIMSRGRRLAQILLVICAHIFIIGPIFGGNSFVIYMYKKLSMDDDEIMAFSTYSNVVDATGLTIAVTVFSKKLKMHDAILGMIASACKVVKLFIYAFGPTKKWLYAGAYFNIFGSVGITVLKSLGSKIVEPDEVGKMFAVMELSIYIVKVVYSEVPPKTFLVISGSMLILAFFIFIVLYIIHKRQQRDVENPARKEIFAHENVITYL